MIINYVLAGLQIMFIFTSFTVERAYCRGPLDPTDSTPLVKQTIEFCSHYNPLFESRPLWLVEATCVHANCYWILYLTILITALLDIWTVRSIQTMILLGIGSKLYAVLFYHYMEFTSSMPPPNPIVYFSAEGSYVISILLVLYKIITSEAAATETQQTQKPTTSTTKQE